MIKKLRIKFVCIVMAIALLMVSGILGMVIYFARQNMEMQSFSMMRAIAASPYQIGSSNQPSTGEEQLPFFTVQISSWGEVLAVEGRTFSQSDREYLVQIITLALESDSESGELQEYDLRYLKANSPIGLSIVYFDVTSETATLKNLTNNCLMIFLATILVFLGISILLSRWVTKPVEKAWTQQRQFVADASHELKTPLAVIMANAELLQNEQAPDEDKQKFSANIMSTTYQMRSLVDNMLEVARVDNGTLNMNLTGLDLSQLVSDAVLSFQFLYEEKNIGLRYAISEGICIHGSEQHLYQVLDVLLDNALKYSTPQGMVSVDLTTTGRNCLLSVASPGDPLSREDLKNIFKRFYRADKARAMNGSYGLGLAIAESIVDAHKGKIWAESADGYNTFFVQLPLH